MSRQSPFVGAGHLQEEMFPITVTLIDTRNHPLAPVADARVSDEKCSVDATAGDFSDVTSFPDLALFPDDSVMSGDVMSEIDLTFPTKGLNFSARRCSRGSSVLEADVLSEFGGGAPSSITNLATAQTSRSRDTSGVSSSTMMERAHRSRRRPRLAPPTPSKPSGSSASS